MKCFSILELSLVSQIANSPFEPPAARTQGMSLQNYKENISPCFTSLVEISFGFAPELISQILMSPSVPAEAIREGIWGEKHTYEHYYSCA